MKLILIGLALLQFALAENGHPSSQYYEEFNWHREAYAKQNQIANMNYMRYDTSLHEVVKKEVEKYGGKCPPTKIVRKGDLEIFLNAGEDESMEHPIKLVPGRTRVATYSNRCNGTWAFNVVVDVPTTEAIHGPPGSKCSAGRASNEFYPSLCLLPDDYPVRRRRDTRFNSFIDTDSLKDKLLEIVQDATEKISEYVQDEEIIENAADAILQAARDTVEEVTSPYTRKNAADPENFKIREESEEEIQKSIDEVTKLLQKLDTVIRFSEISRNYLKGELEYLQKLKNSPKAQGSGHVRKIAAPKFWDSSKFWEEYEKANEEQRRILRGGRVY